VHGPVPNYHNDDTERIELDVPELRARAPAPIFSSFSTDRTSASFGADEAYRVKILTEANGILDTWFGHFDLGRAYLEAQAFPQADSEFDRAIARRGEALSLMDEGPTYGYFPPVYYYRGRVREEMKTGAFADSYLEYLKIRGKSTEDPLLPEIRKRASQ